MRLRPLAEAAGHKQKHSHHGIMLQKLPKSERLTAKKDIDNLFAEGESARSGPVVVKWRTRLRAGLEPECIMLFSAPKRNLKKAHDRNRVKRMLKEIYRLNKQWWWKLDGASNKTRTIAVIYTGRDVPQYAALKAHCEKAAARIGVEKSAPQTPGKE